MKLPIRNYPFRKQKQIYVTRNTNLHLSLRILCNINQFRATKQYIWRVGHWLFTQHLEIFPVSVLDFPLGRENFRPNPRARHIDHVLFVPRILGERGMRNALGRALSKGSWPVFTLVTSEESRPKLQRLDRHTRAGQNTCYTSTTIQRPTRTYGCGRRVTHMSSPGFETEPLASVVTCDIDDAFRATWVSLL